MLAASPKRTPILGTGREYVECSACGNSFEAYRSSARVACSRKCSTSLQAGKRTSSEWDRLRQIWHGMHFRCHNETCPAWEYYGERGVSVCDEWRGSFKAFYAWAIASGYVHPLEIDRIDHDGNYEPSNCRWATRKQQMRNTRKRRNAKTSKYCGVSWCTNASKWRAQICGTERNSTHIGLFLSEVEAAQAYDAIAKQEFGEFASLNF